MHNDNAPFEWVIMNSHEDFPTISLLVKSYMDMDNNHVIPCMIEEVLDFKAFRRLYLWSTIRCLIGHTKAHQF